MVSNIQRRSNALLVLVLAAAVAVLCLVVPVSGLDDAFAKWYLEATPGSPVKPLVRKDKKPSIQLSYIVSDQVQPFHNARIKLFSGDNCDSKFEYEGPLLAISDIDTVPKKGAQQTMLIDVVWKRAAAGGIPMDEEVQFCILVSLYSERNEAAGKEMNSVATVVQWDLGTNEAKLLPPASKEPSLATSDPAKDSRPATASAKMAETKTETDTKPKKGGRWFNKLLGNDKKEDL